MAVCDVDRKHLESAVALGQKKFGETLGESNYEQHKGFFRKFKKKD